MIYILYRNWCFRDNAPDHLLRALYREDTECYPKQTVHFIFSENVPSTEAGRF